MAISLRTRLTLWYSGLLLLALVLFTATVLWLHWHLMVRQADESLRALAIAAVNVVDAELAEHATLEDAAHEMVGVVRQRNYEAAVLDGSGTKLLGSVAEPLLAAFRQSAAGVRTVTGSDGHPWRVMPRAGESSGVRFTVVIGAPLSEIEEQWRALVKACAIGIPFVMLIAAAGGWGLGRRGLAPLQAMADQTRGITERTPNSRIAIAGAGVELDAVASSFNHVLERLGLALATQRRFMADASHELRTPVSIMRTAADVTLSQTGRDEAEYRDALGVVAEQTTRLARLVDDMLVLARADAGGYPIVRSEVDLDGIVLDSIRDFAAKAAAKRITLSSQVRPVSAVADEALLRRLVGNLLSNAIAYTPEGGTVDVAIVEERGATSIRVSDSGPGIPAEDRERVFERFVRLDPARGEGGAGLGLAIARWIAEVHGGQVELLRSDARGSVFAATIPASA
jgi:heavy metal sensor kinase